MLEMLAANYLKGLTPVQIQAGLPRWLRDLSPEQWQAVWAVAQDELKRRALSYLERASR